jgi:hypothetical protein
MTTSLIYVTDGLCPDFPEVSVLEDRLLPARVAYELATQELENAEKALASLGSAKTCLSQCEKEMEESRVWGGWGTCCIIP